MKKKISTILVLGVLILLQNVKLYSQTEAFFSDVKEMNISLGFREYFLSNHEIPGIIDGRKTTKQIFVKNDSSELIVIRLRRKHENIGEEIREKLADHITDRHRVRDFKANSIYFVNDINEKINKDFYKNSSIVIFGEMGIIALELYTKDPSKSDKKVLKIAKKFIGFN